MKIVSLYAAAMVLLTSGSARANQASTMAPAVEKPVLESLPSADDLSRFYPPVAAKENVKGSAAIRCRVTLQHQAVDCVVTSESPPGIGFGQAAIALVQSLRIAPAKANGLPVDGGIFETTFKFQMASNVGQSAVDGYYTTPAKWLTKPTPEQIIAVYPAGGDGGGAVTLLCRVLSGGDLDDCRVWWETPKGDGFGDAALLLAPLFKVADPAFPETGAPLYVHVDVTLFPPQRQTPVPTDRK